MWVWHMDPILSFSQMAINFSIIIENIISPSFICNLYCILNFHVDLDYS